MCLGCLCGKCTKVSGILFIVVGILFLLKDLGTWSFWNISWWTALFILVGVIWVASTTCQGCQSMNCCMPSNGSAKKKK